MRHTPAAAWEIRAAAIGLLGSILLIALVRWLDHPGDRPPIRRASSMAVRLSHPDLPARVAEHGGSDEVAITLKLARPVAS